MAGPADPYSADKHDDDMIGFATPQSLRSRTVSAEPDAAGNAALRRPGDAGAVFRGGAPSPSEARRDGPGAAPDLIIGYVLLLLAVPSFGVSVLLGLVRLYRRTERPDPLERSHVRYQWRTLLTGAAVGAAGIVLLAAPFAVGVPVLFALALWVIVRAVHGFVRLRNGRAISRPDHWWI